jgi:hypothetical protein
MWRILGSYEINKSFEGGIQWSELYGFSGTKRKNKENKPQTLCEVRNQTMWVNKLYGNAQARQHLGQTEDQQKGECHTPGFLCSFF